MTDTVARMAGAAVELEGLYRAVLTSEEVEPALTEAQPRIAALLQEAEADVADLVSRLGMLRARLLRSVPAAVEPYTV